MNDEKRQIVLIGLLILTNIIFSILPLQYGFVADDFTLVPQNERIQKLDLFIEQLMEKYFHPPHFPYLPYWRPAALFSFYLDYQVWGPNPFGFHLTNALLHIVLLLLLYFLMLQLTGDTNKSWWVCLLYSVHPARADIVSWISGRTDLLANLFIILTLLFFFLWRKKHHPILFISLSLSSYVTALLAKEHAVILPAAIIGWLILEERTATDVFSKTIKKAAQEWLPLSLYMSFTIAFLFVHSRITASSGILSKLSWHDIPLFFKTVGVYLRMVFLPYFPTHYISIPMDEFYSLWTVPLLTFALFAVFLTFILRKPDHFPLSRATLPFLLFMLPLCLISLIPSYPQLAMRFASLGAIFAAGAIVDGAHFLKKGLRLILLIFIFISWGTIFIIHQTGYKNNTVFYKRVVAIHPTELLAKRAYALELAINKQYDESLRLCEEILTSPNNSRVTIIPKTKVLKANLLVIEDRVAEGMVLAESVLNESQDSEMIRECHIILAYGYMKLNQPEKELFHIQRANAIERSETNLVRQAILLLKLARVEEAKALLESSLRFFPKNEQIKELLNRADQLPKK